MALKQTSQVTGFGHLIGERNNSIESRNTIAPFKTISSEELMRQGTTFEGNAAVEYVAISTQFSALKKSFDIEGVPEDKYTEASVLAFLHLNPKASKEFEQLQPEMAMVTPVGTVIKHSDSFTFVPNPPHRKKDNGPVTISFSRDQIDNVPTTSVHDIERLKLTVGHLAAQVAKRSAITNIRKGPNVGQRGFKRPPNALIATIALVIALYAYAGRDQISAVNKSILNFFGLGNIPVPAEQAAGDEEAAQGSDETSPEGDSYIYPTPTELTESEVPDNTPTTTGPDPDDEARKIRELSALTEELRLNMPKNSLRVESPLVTYADPSRVFPIGLPEANKTLWNDVNNLLKIASGPNADEDLAKISGVKPFILYGYDTGMKFNDMLPEKISVETLKNLSEGGWTIVLLPANNEVVALTDLLGVDENPRVSLVIGDISEPVGMGGQIFDTLTVPGTSNLGVQNSLVLGGKGYKVWNQMIAAFIPKLSEDKSELNTLLVSIPSESTEVDLTKFDIAGIAVFPPSDTPESFSLELQGHLGAFPGLNKVLSGLFHLATLFR